MLLDVLQFPDAGLRKKADPVREDEVTPDLRELAENMAETMYSEPGIGLAATQVGVEKRLIVMDVDWPDDGERNLRMLFNPQIVDAQGKQAANRRKRRHRDRPEPRAGSLDHRGLEIQPPTA